MQQLSLFAVNPPAVAPTAQEVGGAYASRSWAKVSVWPNFWHTYEGEGACFSWDESLRCGRSYLVGPDVPMSEFIKSHRSPLSKWQKLAYAWALANPSEKLVVRGAKNEWEVYVRGEYVEFGLPHHDAGGERHYVSKDGKSKILVNVD